MATSHTPFLLFLVVLLLPLVHCMQFSTICNEKIQSANTSYIEFCDANCDAFVRKLPMSVVRTLSQRTAKDGYVNNKGVYYSAIDDSIVVGGNFVKQVTFSRGIQTLTSALPNGYLAKYSANPYENVVSWAVVLGYTLELADFAVLPDGTIGVLGSFQGSLLLYTDAQQISSQEIQSEGTKDAIFLIYNANAELQHYIQFKSNNAIIPVTVNVATNSSFIISGRFYDTVLAENQYVSSSSSAIASFVAIINSTATDGSYVHKFFALENTFIRAATLLGDDTIFIAGLFSESMNFRIYPSGWTSNFSTSHYSYAAVVNASYECQWVQPFLDYEPYASIASQNRPIVTLLLNPRIHEMQSQVLYINYTNGEIIQTHTTETNFTVLMSLFEDKNGDVFVVGNLENTKLLILHSVLNAGMSVLKNTGGTATYEPRSLIIDPHGVFWIAISVLYEYQLEVDFEIEKFSYKTGFAIAYKRDCTCADPYCKEFTCYSYKRSSVYACSGNGVCTAPNTCTCEKTVSGAFCQIHTCNGVSSLDPTVCSGNGQCQSDGKCKCFEGFSGVNCVNAQCSRSCRFGICDTTAAICICNNQTLNSMVHGDFCEAKVERKDAYYLPLWYSHQNSEPKIMPMSSIKYNSFINIVKIDYRNRQNVISATDSHLITFYKWDTSANETVQIPDTGDVSYIEVVRNNVYVAVNNFGANDDKKVFIYKIEVNHTLSLEFFFSSVQMVKITSMTSRRGNPLVISGVYQGRFSVLSCTSSFTSTNSAFVLVYDTTSKNCTLLYSPPSVGETKSLLAFDDTQTTITNLVIYDGVIADTLFAPGSGRGLYLHTYDYKNFETKNKAVIFSGNIDSHKFLCKVDKYFTYYTAFTFSGIIYLDSANTRNMTSTFRDKSDGAILKFDKFGNEIWSLQISCSGEDVNMTSLELSDDTLEMLVGGYCKSDNVTIKTNYLQASNMNYNVKCTKPNCGFIISADYFGNILFIKSLDGQIFPRFSLLKQEWNQLEYVLVTAQEFADISTYSMESKIVTVSPLIIPPIVFFLIACYFAPFVILLFVFSIVSSNAVYTISKRKNEKQQLEDQGLIDEDTQLRFYNDSARFHVKTTLSIREGEIYQAKYLAHPRKAYLCPTFATIKNDNVYKFILPTYQFTFTTFVSNEQSKNMLNQSILIDSSKKLALYWIAKGVSGFHRNGMVHGDLKEDNIMCQCVQVEQILTSAENFELIENNCKYYQLTDLVLIDWLKKDEAIAHYKSNDLLFIQYKLEDLKKFFEIARKLIPNIEIEVKQGQGGVTYSTYLKAFKNLKATLRKDCKAYAKPPQVTDDTGQKVIAKNTFSALISQEDYTISSNARNFAYAFNLIWLGMPFWLFETFRKIKANRISNIDGKNLKRRVWKESCSYLLHIIAPQLPHTSASFCCVASLTVVILSLVIAVIMLIVFGLVGRYDI